MGEYEELVELGIEGVDKVVDKYHDKAFDTVGKHSPAWHRRHDRPQQQQGYRKPASTASHSGHEASRGRGDNDGDSDMYNPDRRQERDYKDRGEDRRDSRYMSDETFYYRGPEAGTVAMRGSDPYNNAREYEVQRYQQPQYDDRQDNYGQQRRPGHQRRRSSWSPQRLGRDHGGSRRARSRSRSRSTDKTNRIAATVAGGLIGGLLGNHIQKGKKYDTAATIAGAVIGGIGAKEASEQWDKRRSRREDCDEKWDEKFGDGRDRRLDEYYEDDRDHRRDDRDRRRDDRYDDDRRRH